MWRFCRVLKGGTHSKDRLGHGFMLSKDIYVARNLCAVLTTSVLEIPCEYESSVEAKTFRRHSPC